MCYLHPILHPQKKHKTMQLRWLVPGWPAPAGPPISNRKATITLLGSDQLKASLMISAVMFCREAIRNIRQINMVILRDLVIPRIISAWSLGLQRCILTPFPGVWRKKMEFGEGEFPIVLKIDQTPKQDLPKKKNISFSHNHGLYGKWLSSWWFQPISKILVKLDHFPR